MTTKDEAQAADPDPLHLSRILHELAGAASMCWTPRPTGVFDSQEAVKHVVAAIDEIRARYQPPPAAQPVVPNCDTPTYCKSVQRCTADDERRATPPAAPVQEPVMVNMSPPATQRDRWMYEQGRLAERDPRTHSEVAWELAEKVRRDLDRQSCPDAFMRIAVESIVKNYTTPPAAQPALKPLTDKQIDAIVERLDPLFLDTPMGFVKDFARAIEAAHGIKGDA